MAENYIGGASNLLHFALS